MLNSKLANILQSGRPLAIDPLSCQNFLATYDNVISNQEISAKLVKFANKISLVGKKKAAIGKKKADEELDETMFCPPPMPYVTDEGIAVIPVEGVIGKNLTLMEKCLGCTDINDIMLALKAYAMDASVSEVVLKINSGGGTTTGLQEIAKYIRNYPKPTIAFTDEDMASAAYWVGSACQRLVVTPSSSVVSCGIYVTATDESAKFTAEGKTVVIIKSGIYKGAGVEGTSLTKEQSDWIQYEVDELHKRFISDVMATRPFVDPNDLQGQSFYGDVAAERKLVTGLVDSFDELLENIVAERTIIDKAAIAVRSSLNNSNIR